MAHDGEGTIYIPMEELWKLVMQYAPGDGGAEIAFGVPQFPDGTQGDMTVDYAFSTEAHPSEWAKKPKAISQWDDLREAHAAAKKKEPDNG